MRACSSAHRKLIVIAALWILACIALLLHHRNARLVVKYNNEDQSTRTQSPLSSVAPLVLAPEFALPDNSNAALYYSFPSSSSSPSLSSSVSSSSSSFEDVVAVASSSSSVSDDAANDKNEDKTQKTIKIVKTPAPPAMTTPKLEPHELSEPIDASNQQCSYNYPSLFDLKFSNIYWQMFQTIATNESSPATFYLYNAYFDDRWRAGAPSVRILGMIDRVHPPPANCLFWPSTNTQAANGDQPLVSRAEYVYAWYPKWGNYRDGILQPFIVTCPLPRGETRVPDSVTLADVPLLVPSSVARSRRATVAARSQRQQQQESPILVPASFSSSAAPAAETSAAAAATARSQANAESLHLKPDCAKTLPLTNNLPVFNERPSIRQKFAVCVKGLDFPAEDISVRLVEWLELLNLLGASKVFLYNLNVNENTSRVLKYYQQRGLVELSQLTLPGNQPNLPEYQHLYLKTKTTNKRQNELIPYNDCLYRNLYSFEYLALLDIDEMIMPLHDTNWFELMAKVERRALAQQNYSRASYNFRNVYFFDDLAGLAGTSSSSPPSSSPSLPPLSQFDVDEWDSDDDNDHKSATTDDAQNSEQKQQQLQLELQTTATSVEQQLEAGIPPYLHMMQHVYRSKNYTKPSQYVKCFHNVERVVSLHNHFPLNCFGQCTTFSVPVQLAHLQHYRKDCVGPLKQSCKTDFRVFTTRDTTIWRFKAPIIRRATKVLTRLGLIDGEYGKRRHLHHHIHGSQSLHQPSSR